MIFQLYNWEIFHAYVYIQDPPERPRGHKHQMGVSSDENFQLWSLSGESCPEGTIPIRRTREEDMLRASSISRFGRKIRRVRRDTSGNGHEVCTLQSSEQSQKEKQQKNSDFLLSLFFLFFFLNEVK